MSGRHTLHTRIQKRRGGSVNTVVALSMMALCGFAALVVDIGYMRMVRQQLQVATDTAGIAAVRHLTGTDFGMERARGAVVELAALNIAAGETVALDPNADNAPDGEIVMGNWDGAAFAPSGAAEDVNAIRITAARTELPAFFSAIAFGRDSLGAAAVTTVLRGEELGAGTVPYYLPIGLPLCTITNRTEQQIQDFTVRFSPAGADTSGWAILGSSPNAARVASHLGSMGSCMQQWNTTGHVDGSCTEASVDDLLYLGNGVQASTIQNVADAIVRDGIPWDASVWGTIPARASGSDVPVASYGKTLAGPIPVFDGGTSYCNGGGGNWNQTRRISGFVWGAIYDARSGGPASQKNIWARLDMSSYRAIGDWHGGSDMGISWQTPGRVVQ